MVGCWCKAALTVTLGHCLYPNVEPVTVSYVRGLSFVPFLFNRIIWEIGSMAPKEYCFCEIPFKDLRFVKIAPKESKLPQTSIPPVFS